MTEGDEGQRTLAAPQDPGKTQNLGARQAAPACASSTTEPPPYIFALLGLMVLLWSANFIVAKYALREFSPVMAGALRFTLAGAIIGPMYLWTTRKSPPKQWNRRNLTKLLGTGILGVGLNQLFFLMGLEQTSVGHASLVIASTPVMVLLLSAATGHERITSKKVAGFAVAIGGVIFLQVSPAKSSQASILGDIFILLACLAFASFTVFGKTIVSRYDGLTVNTFAYVGSGVILSPITLWYGFQFNFAAVTWAGWTALLYMAVFPSLLCYMIYYHALHFIPASRIAALSYLQPFLATLLAIVLLGEHLTTTLVIGGLLVITGVLLAERS
ncbi:MAG: EamA family transporter [Acidobacteriia bacterium]|nr:EamA family transporter [Terriglobia bacterium]